MQISGDCVENKNIVCLKFITFHLGWSFVSYSFEIGALKIIINTDLSSYNLIDGVHIQFV